MILLDTCSAVWLAGSPGKLSEPAVLAIKAARRRRKAIALSGITLWEVSLLATRGRITLPAPLPAFVKYLERSFEILPLDGAIAQRSMLFGGNYPKDPADRMIGATAIVHGLHLVTADSRIRESGEVLCIW